MSIDRPAVVLTIRVYRDTVADVCASDPWMALRLLADDAAVHPSLAPALFPTRKAEAGSVDDDDVRHVVQPAGLHVGESNPCSGGANPATCGRESPPQRGSVVQWAG